LHRQRGHGNGGFVLLRERGDILRLHWKLCDILRLHWKLCDILRVFRKCGYGNDGIVLFWKCGYGSDGIVLFWKFGYGDPRGRLI
jgi:hypothetical protein